MLLSFHFVLGFLNQNLEPVTIRLPNGLLMHRVYTEAAAETGELAARPTEHEVRQYVERIAKEWSNDPSDPQHILSDVYKLFQCQVPEDELKDMEFDRLRPMSVTTLSDQMDSFLDNLMSAQEDGHESDDDLEIDLDEGCPKKLLKLSLPSAEHTSDLPYRPESGQPASAPDQTHQPRPATSYFELSELGRRTEDAEKFTAVGEALATRYSHPSGACKACKKIQVRSENPTQAKLVQTILSGDHFHALGC